MAQQLVHRFRSLVTWATTPHRRPARRHSRGRQRPGPAPMHAERAVRQVTLTHVGPATPTPQVQALARPLGHAETPTLRHLGVVGLPGTIGAAARLASARAAAERRFNGTDPRAAVVDRRHPSMWRREGPHA